MARLTQPSEVKIQTKEGECTITLHLDLNININSNGVANLDSVPEQRKIKEKEETEWAIPDFSVPKEKIQFGKNA